MRPPLRRDVLRIDGEPYLRRWILRLPGGRTLRLHVFERDDGPTPHDHPFAFVSVALWGTALESLYPLSAPGLLREAPPAVRRVLPFVPRRCRADLVHRVHGLRGRLVTLVATGPRVREWGFFPRSRGVPRLRRWVPHREHVR